MSQLRKIRYTYIDAGVSSQIFNCVIYPNHLYFNAGAMTCSASSATAARTAGRSKEKQAMQKLRMDISIG